MVTVLVPRENLRTLNSNTDSILAIIPNLTIRKKYPETHFLKVVTYQFSLEIKVLKPLLLLLLLSRFSRVRLCETPQTEPNRLPRPWDSPSKNTGVGCHFLLQCMRVKSEREVAQSCLTPSDPMDCSPPGSSVHGIFQAKVLEWGAIAFSDLSHQLAIKYCQCKQVLMNGKMSITTHKMIPQV